MRRASYSRLHYNYFLSLCVAQKRELIKFVNCKMHLATLALLESPVDRAVTTSSSCKYPFPCVNDISQKFNKMVREVKRRELTFVILIRIEENKTTFAKSNVCINNAFHAHNCIVSLIVTVTISEARCMRIELHDTAYRTRLFVISCYCLLASQLPSSSISDASTRYVFPFRRFLHARARCRDARRCNVLVIRYTATN